VAHFVVDESDRIERIELPGGEWVDVIGQLSLFERKRLLGAVLYGQRQRQLSQMQRKRDGEEAAEEDEAEAYMESYAAAETAGLVVGIKAWSFKDSAGEPIPVTREWIRKLDDFTGEFISQQLDRLWARRGEEEAKNSGAPGARTSAAKRRSPRNSAG